MCVCVRQEARTNGPTGVLTGTRALTGCLLKQDTKHRPEGRKGEAVGTHASFSPAAVEWCGGLERTGGEGDPWMLQEER